jgi:hypothetical protein
MSEPKPCPFCGAEAKLYNGYNNFYSIEHLDGCYFKSPGAFSRTILSENNEEMIRRWNDRDRGAIC